MTTSDKNTDSERERTDKSLRTEREKTDEAIIIKKKSLEDEADSVILRERENADAALTKVRKKADRMALDSGAPNSTVTKRRTNEDDALQKERETADKNNELERAKVNSTLRRLLPLEREATDKTLSTERVRSDNAIKNRDDFLGTVCHDLRNLLSGIVLSTELLKHETAKTSGSEFFSTTLHIKRYAAQMNRLIGDLLDVTSIESGKISITPEHLDTTLLVNEAVETFQVVAETKELTLNAVGMEAALFAHFDHDRMLQVFTNLLTNAIKFTPPGGKITIEREAKENELWFSIVDTGSGIPQELLEMIFERFWQVGKNDRRGLGLGLFISKSIVESHGGTIWVESKPGVGSRFIFTLPR